MYTKLKPLTTQKVMISTELATSKYILPTSELAIFLGILGKISQSKEIDKDSWFSLSPQEYADIRGVTLKAGQVALKEAVTNLWERTIEAGEGDRKIKYRWIISLELDTFGAIRIQWHPTIIPLICQLKNYCSYDLVKIGNIKHIFTYKLFFLIRDESFQQNTGELEFEVDEFRKHFGYTEKSYEEYRYLKRNVLLTAMDEMVEKGLVQWITIKDEVRVNRKVVKFKIAWGFRDNVIKRKKSKEVV
jgi:hypothetical protein